MDGTGKADGLGVPGLSGWGATDSRGFWGFGKATRDIGGFTAILYVECNTTLVWLEDWSRRKPSGETEPFFLIRRHHDGAREPGSRDDIMKHVMVSQPLIPHETRRTTFIESSQDASNHRCRILLRRVKFFLIPHETCRTLSINQPDKNYHRRRPDVLHHENSIIHL